MMKIIASQLESQLSRQHDLSLLTAGVL